jgi:peptidoglycan glycosyltransferase
MIRWMRSPGPGLCFVLLLTSSCLTSCTNDPPVPRAAGTVEVFVHAINARDADRIVTTFDHHTRLRWKPSHVDRFVHKVLSEGQVTDLSMEQTGRVPQLPDDKVRGAKGAVVTSAPYQITYRSSAAKAPVTLRGSLHLIFEKGRWNIDWSRGIFWPGVKGARGFSVTYHWPRRAAILDRRGHRLAVGSGSSRRYPFHALAGTSIGHMAPLTRADIGDAAPGHQPGDLVGASGLELGLERQLAGRPASRLQVVGRGQKVLKTLGGRKSHPGHNVKTTLDTSVEAAAEAGYGTATGGAVVLDPHTGDLLAVVSSSPFDPNNYLGVSGVQPFNRALSGLYPPGSSMKVVTASAALDAHKVTATTQLSGPEEFRGVRNFESESFNSLSFAQATEFSVNTAFAQVALKLGPRLLHHYADLFGFNRDPGLPVGAATSSFPLPQDEGDLMWGAVGQAQDLATPLEMASVAGAVANRGKRMDPRITLATPPRGHRVISRPAASTMTQLMELVVQGGTGTAANIPGVTVAGKTGTAEVDVDGVRKNHAWFVCFAPATQPKVAVAVVVEYGGVGGVVAAPLARSILERVLPLVK